jgi:hypothetical protein
MKFRLLRILGCGLANAKFAVDDARRGSGPGAVRGGAEWEIGGV